MHTNIAILQDRASYLYKIVYNFFHIHTHSYTYVQFLHTSSTTLVQILQDAEHLQHTLMREG